MRGFTAWQHFHLRISQSGFSWHAGASSHNHNLNENGAHKQQKFLSQELKAGQPHASKSPRRVRSKRAEHRHGKLDLDPQHSVPRSKSTKRGGTPSTLQADPSSPNTKYQQQSAEATVDAQQSQQMLQAKQHPSVPVGHGSEAMQHGKVVQNPGTNAGGPSAPGNGTKKDTSTRDADEPAPRPRQPQSKTGKPPKRRSDASAAGLEKQTPRKRHSPSKEKGKSVSQTERQAAVQPDSNEHVPDSVLPGNQIPDAAQADAAGPKSAAAMSSSPLAPSSRGDAPSGLGQPMHAGQMGSLSQGAEGPQASEALPPGQDIAQNAAGHDSARSNHAVPPVDISEAAAAAAAAAPSASKPPRPGRPIRNANTRLRRRSSNSKTLTDVDPSKPGPSSKDHRSQPSLPQSWSGQIGTKSAAPQDVAQKQAAPRASQPFATSGRGNAAKPPAPGSSKSAGISKGARGSEAHASAGDGLRRSPSMQPSAIDSSSRKAQTSRSAGKHVPSPAKQAAESPGSQQLEASGDVCELPGGGAEPVAEDESGQMTDAIKELPEIGMQLPLADWVPGYLRQRLLDPGSRAAADMALRPALQTLQVCQVSSHMLC